MPSLQTLPIELRQKIYRLALIPLESTRIAAYRRQKLSGHRSSEVALKVFVNGIPHSAPNNDTALIRVSNEVSADARPLLYESFHFTFQCSRALELFLEQIGDMRKHLCHVALGPTGYDYELGSQGPFSGSVKRSFAMLAAATGLQTLRVSHYDFCRGRHLSLISLKFNDLAYVSAQLLFDIHEARKAKGLTTDLAGMLDIVEIELPDCDGCLCCDKSGKQLGGRRRVVSFKQYTFIDRERKCLCVCSDAESNNEELKQAFKRYVASFLRLGDEIPSELAGFGTGNKQTKMVS